MSKENVNMIVKYHNKLNNLNTGRFTAVEADIFFSLISKIKDTDGNLVITFEELKNLSNYYSRDMKRFIHDIEKTFSKYLNLKYRDEDDENITIANVFSHTVVAKHKGLVLLSVNPGMEDVILSVSENFTRFELQEFTCLRGSYAKTLYRLLKQYRHTGSLFISLDDFKFKLDIPKSYKITHIDQKVLNPSIKELSSYFENLSVEKEYKKSASGKGRPSVVGYIFTFKPEERFKNKPKVEKESENKIKKVPYPCPACGGELIERKMNGKIAFVHPDGHLPDAKCSAIFNSIDEVMPKVDHFEEPEDLSIKQEENKKKISKLIKGIFR